MTRLRVTVVLILLLAGRAVGQAPPRPSVRDFNTALFADVVMTALVFIEPRALDAPSVPQLTMWGLRGLAAIDPNLAPELQDTTLRLTYRSDVLVLRPAPRADDPQAWAGAAAQITEAAVNRSDAVRRAGGIAITRSFFEELFNHLDPYSRYVPPPYADRDREQRSGGGGIGVQLARQGGGIVVTSVAADSPAEDADIQPGDRIVEVDGQPTRGRTVDVVTDWLAGDEDTSVSVAVRSRSGQLRTIEMARALIAPETVFPDRKGDILTLRVTGFNNATAQRISRILGQESDGQSGRRLRGVVVDVRGNRGGVLRQAVTAADLLMSSGLIATTAGRHPQAAHEFRSTGADIIGGLPLVVLVDGRSASAAEVLAAALIDNRRAVVVGSSTLGKGLVQTITTLPDGGELFVSWSRVLAPLGWPVQGLGVMPNVCTSLGQDNLDRQSRDLSEGRLDMAGPLAAHSQARAPLPTALVIDIRNACPAAVGRDADAATARFLIEHPAAYTAALLPAEIR